MERYNQMLMFKKQHIVTGVITAGVIGGFILLRYLPLKKQIESAKCARGAQTALISKADSEKKILVSLGEQLQEYQKVSEKYQNQVPGKPDLGSFLHNISSLMNSYGLSDQLIKPGESVLVNADSKGNRGSGGNRSFELYGIPIDMKCKGRLEQLFNFYRSLEGFDRLIRIQEVTVENDKEFSGNLSMNTKAFIYYMKEKDVEKTDES